METSVRKRQSAGPDRRRSAFTLIEMMVVVALVGILLGGVFHLINAAGDSAKRSETIERMQRLENAISGFYAKYGTYPPVPRHGSPDPFAKENPDGSSTTVSALDAVNANRAAACQPVSFEFPSMKAMENYIDQNYAGVLSANDNPNAFDKNKELWPEVRLFRFGLVSFLISRYDALGDYDDQGKLENADFAPNPVFFTYAQWTTHNGTQEALGARILKDREACAEWLPNLKGLIYGGKKFAGVDTAPPEEAFPKFTEPFSHGSGSLYVLGMMTVRDAWDKSLYYYSAPPYQSYRLWSSGPDGNTFPADYPLAQLKSSDRKIVGAWIKDDIVRASR